MDESNVHVFEDNSTLERTLRHSLHFASPQESLTYLVEIPDVKNDAPRPSHQASSRPRTSTIVNTLQPSEIVEDDHQDPLELYIRKNLPSFRKSLTPEDFQTKVEGRPVGRASRVSTTVNPTCAEPLNADFNVDQPKRSHVQNSSEIGGELKVPKDNDCKRNGSKELKGQAIMKTPKMKERRSKKRDESLHHDSKDVVVMPMDTCISVSHDSPFTKEQRHTNKSPLSRVRVLVSVESSSDNSDNENIHENLERRARESKSTSRKSYGGNDDKYNRQSREHLPKRNDSRKRGNTLERGKREDSSKRRGSRKSNGQEKFIRDKYFIENGTVEIERNEPKEMFKGDRRSLDRYSSKRSEGGFLELELEDKSQKEKYKREKPRKRSKDSRDSRSDKGKDLKSNPVIYTTGERLHKDPSIDFDLSPRSNLHGSRKQDKSPELKRTEPFPAAKSNLVYAMTESNTENAFENKNRNERSENKTSPRIQRKTVNIPDRAVGGAEREDRKDRGQPKKFVTVKAPRSATKMIAKRRYHIQIPEHGRAETWFNVRFNMDDENNVEMNYEGPVKIKSYYSSNNYS